MNTHDDQDTVATLEEHVRMLRDALEGLMDFEGLSEPDEADLEAAYQVARYTMAYTG